MNLKDAQNVANAIKPHIMGYCLSFSVAGELRRRKKQVEVIDFVVVPMMETGQLNIFGETVVPTDLLSARIRELRERKFFKTDPHGVKPNGVPCHLLIFADARVRIVVASRADFGRQVAFATGDSEFVRALKQPRRQGGLLPDGWENTTNGLKGPGGIVACHDEDAYFRVMGLRDVPSPENRNRAAASALAAKRMELSR